MNWSDEGIVLGGRKFGEGGLILDVLTATRGRRSGLVYGGSSRKKRGQFEPGNTISLTWKGRLEEQLGRFEVAEAVRERANRLLDDRAALAGVSAITALLRGGLDEGDMAGSQMYEATTLLLDQLGQSEIWPTLYVRWEMGLLSALGFGLDLSACALSGANDGLTHVSPKTGRAVRGSEAEGYVDRLFPLPAFLLSSGALIGPDDLRNGLDMLGHFLELRVFGSMNRGMPPERARLVSQLI